MRCWPKSVLLISFLLATKELGSSGDKQKKIISAPDKPTRVFIGDNVSLAWRYSHPNHFTLCEVVFGIWDHLGRLTTKLVAVNASGFPDVRRGYESKISWAGNLTSSLAVFVFHDVQPADGKKYGIHVEYHSSNPLTDTVWLQVVAKPISDHPRITYVTTPSLLRIGQNVSLNCTASGLSPINVTWYKGHKVLASGISEAVFTLKNITDKDWGEFLCVAKNSAGVNDTKSVIIKVLPESPTILNTKKKIENASWTLRWSAVYSEGHNVTSYTVWHRVENVTRDNMTREKPWLQENVTGLKWHKELAADTSYMFAVTAWNRWGESKLETEKMLFISTVFLDRNTVSPEPEASVTPNSNKKGVSMSTESILYGVIPALLFFLSLVAAASCLIRRKRTRDEENNTNTIRNMRGDFNQPTTGECFVLTEFRPEMNSITPGSMSNELSRTVVPLRGSERSGHNQDIHVTVIKRPTLEEENKIAMETNEALQRVSNSEDYIQVDNDNLEAATKSTGPLSSLQFTGMLQENPLYKRETAVAQHCASVKPADQSNRFIFQTGTRHRQHNDPGCTTTDYQNASTDQSSLLSPACSGDTPYARVNCNTNWEVSRDHLSLFERIGGGSFGQVWKGAALDLAGVKGWSVVAVKMLKENSSKSDVRDLLSELDLLKKLKPHPNVIQLLGCLTKDVVRCKGRPDFRPPLVILEFVPHGDLLGYLRKSKGETDDYYNLRSKEVPRKIPIQQLYKFASDIARGMEFISAHQLIHRDLAARNVLVGQGLRCKITDFGMARDLRKAEIYVMRSNGVVPVKWLAIESLKKYLFTTESDVWSYGIVLYEIFTLGENPYEGMNSEEVLSYVASGGRLPRTSSMSSELYNLMLQCWQENPSKRPKFRSIASWMETVAYEH